ncbi:hypothetical protein E8E14_011042 [Neopestalotiopsis sp. 37M]|nr:hypothetical protein E8E14_011042 [Neopestalotiopsis sp. 37M]
MRTQSPIIVGLALLGGALGHLGGAHEELKMIRDFRATQQVRDLSHCADKLKARGVEARNVARRWDTVNKARAKRNLHKKDLDSVLATSHNETALGYTTSTDPAALFASNSSCLLTPDLTQGPYYISGEQIRRDVREDQQGIDTVIEYQIIDVDTCEPVPQVYLELWHCNATGVYSGVVADGNGDGWQDQSNINKTFLRGLQQTDDAGVAQFETIFAGHYSGRATHVHVLIHTDVKVNKCNNTLIGSATPDTDIPARHVGQSYFDQDLIDLVDAFEPYSINTQELIENADDVILPDAVANGADPFFEYAFLGSDVTDGLFAWISLGINMSESVSVTPAVHLTAQGGVNTTDFSQDDYIGAPTK